MKISVIQHVPFQGPGMIQDWAKDRGHILDVFNACDGELPVRGTFDLLVVLGGSMSANDTDDWLNEEKEFIKDAIDSGTLVFGICLGSQLIASVLGANISKMKEKEIGWYPLLCADNFLKTGLEVFHWHGETFELPQGGHLVASSPGCTNQAFAYEDTVLGIQFHLEMDKPSLQQMIANQGEDLVEGRFIQTGKEMLSKDSFIDKNRIELYDLLDGFEMRLDEDQM